jgi:hypothetical protein
MVWSARGSSSATPGHDAEPVSHRYEVGQGTSVLQLSDHWTHERRPFGTGKQELDGMEPGHAELQHPLPRQRAQVQVGVPLGARLVGRVDPASSGSGKAVWRAGITARPLTALAA